MPITPEELAASLARIRAWADRHRNQPDPLAVLDDLIRKAQAASGA